jgi:hypothetical protein
VKHQFAGNPRILRPLMVAALSISAVLLLRFAVDFNAQGALLAVPFWGLVVFALIVMGLNALSNTPVSSNEESNTDRRMMALLLISVPVAFLASSLDCTGLSLRGCSPFCTIIKLVWIPLVAIVCAAYYLTRDGRGLVALSIISYVPLIPHCICYNVANGWWIDRIGASPECYSWGFVVTSLVVGSLAAGMRYSVTIGVSLLIVAGSMGFFVAHHYFRFPW